MAHRCKLFAAVVAMAVPASAVWTAASALGSSACEGPVSDRLKSGDYTQRSGKPWVLEQKATDGKIVARTFNVYVPPQHAQGAPLPLVIDLHGTNAGAWLQDRGSRMREKGKEEGFIVLQPDSLPAWTNTAQAVKERKVSDVEFIRELLVKLDKLVCFDLDRIFATGGSAGGSMATVLACASASQKLGGYSIAAIAPVLATPGWPDMQPPVCAAAEKDKPSPLATNPVPMRVIISNNDKLLIFGFSGEDRSRMNASIRRAVDAWAKENGCSGPPASQATGQTGYGVLVETVQHGCANVPNRRGDTVLDFFDTGSPERSGHFGPSGAEGQYAATKVIWEFFKEHPRP